MAKLGILIAHYKEPLEQLKGMLDSINRQNIDFNQVKVCILNDGDDVVFQQSDFDGYNYSIECSIAERCGTSKMRNKLLGLSKDDFVWFLDSDDYLIDDTLQDVLDELSSTQNLDLMFVGALWENKKNLTSQFYPDYYSFSIMGCSIFRREFLINNNISSDESVFLAGDVILETLPKYYTGNRKRLNKPVLFYRYHPMSAVHNRKNNGWYDQAQIVMCHLIERLISDGKIQEAYYEYLHYVFTYNSKKVHDAFKDYFQELGMYTINFKMDLR